MQEKIEIFRHRSEIPEANLGSFIEARIRNKNISKAKLASTELLSFFELNSILAGKFPPPNKISNLFRIFDALDLPMEEVVAALLKFRPKQVKGAKNRFDFIKT